MWVSNRFALLAEEEGESRPGQDMTKLRPHAKGRAGGARGGGMKWVVKKPVVDSGCSHHFLGRDVESCVVEVREMDSEFVGVEGDVARAESDMTVDLPRVECVDRRRRTARLDGAFSRQQLHLLTMLIVFLISTSMKIEKSMFLLQGVWTLKLLSPPAIFPNSVPSAAVRQLDRVVGESVSSISALVPFSPPFAAGSQLQAGHLELRSQQQGVGGGEEKKKQSGQGREPVQAAQPAEKEGEGEVVLPDILDDDSLFSLNLLGESGGAAAFASFLVHEGEQQGSRETEGVQEAQDDKKVQGAQEGKRVQGAQDDSKEGERKKVRREGNGFRKAPQRLMVDKKVVDQMIKHVNSRKGHIDANEEEVEKSLFDEAMQGELKSFEKNKPTRVLQFIYGHNVSTSSGYLWGLSEDDTLITWLGEEKLPAKWNKCGMANADKVRFDKTWRDFQRRHPGPRGFVPLPRSFYLPEGQTDAEAALESREGVVLFVKEVGGEDRAEGSVGTGEEEAEGQTGEETEEEGREERKGKTKGRPPHDSSASPFVFLEQLFGTEKRDRLWADVEAAVTKTVLAHLGFVERGHREEAERFCGRSADCSPECFNLLAVDLLVDSDGEMRVLEAMGMSSWAAGTVRAEEQMIAEVLALLDVTVLPSPARSSLKQRAEGERRVMELLESSS
uniref:Uncharacterized protein n=1 Tax=Chromera velia CCMP2878 TaxID=1169474 RepID=A0A0G4H9C3_9ALVE|eukprot:Cvel_25229.t1-p1 / transcript=Cvel_25229.t1 / gene=Cvel_25229 / organism=Chromera_velia_CCMP2878 / gene_product=hypothetical protein / transcript_product=hypothetical protein / location=Cvel_scaffold2829:7398-15489(-) / protein_length=671 / sequence_SO=supercontig / SO=protein_coding / is_pseudo=false